MGALGVFGLSYDLETVRNALPIKEFGVSLLDMEQFLIAHGLNVTARKAVTFRELDNWVTPLSAAIVLLHVGNDPNDRGQYHYVLALRKKHNAPLLIADLPNDLREANSSFEERFERTGGVVLFLRRESVDNLKLRATLQPASIDLGDIDVSGENRTVTFRLLNCGVRPIPITGIRVSCGCMAAEVPSQILRVGSEVPINVTITASAWGTGSSSRMISVDSNGSQLVTGIVTATGIAPFDNSKSTVRPQRLDWNLSGEQWVDATTAVPAQAISIRSNARPDSELKVTCQDSWIVLQLDAIGETDWRLNVSISVTEELRRLLASSRARVESSVAIDLFGRQISVPVTIARESLIGFEKPIVSFKSDAASSALLIISPRHSGSRRELQKGKVAATLNGEPLIQSETESFHVRLPIDKLRKNENIVEVSIASTYGMDFATGIVFCE